MSILWMLATPNKKKKLVKGPKGVVNGRLGKNAFGMLTEQWFLPLVSMPVNFMLFCVQVNEVKF